MAEVITEAFHALLESQRLCDDFHERGEGEFDDDDGTSQSGHSATERTKQGYLCGALAKALTRNGNRTGPASEKGDGDGGITASSLRDVFGDQASALGPLVGPMLQDRVDNQDLLPATQDVEANEEVLDSSVNARTLTATALQAAWLYAQVLTLPGALGSGLVDLEWLTALNAVVRRWVLECCGREQQLHTAHPHNPRVASPTKSPPKKRSRRTKLQDTPPPSPSDSETTTSQDEPTHGMYTDGNVLTLGLQVAMAICGVPMQREFASWSFEAREVVLDAVAASLGTAAALQPIMRLPLDNQTCCRIGDNATTSIKLCLTNACSGKSEVARQHETAVLISRGLLRLLQFKEIVPNGERGKLDAHVAATEALRHCMEYLTTYQSSLRDKRGRRSTLGDATNQATPCRRRIRGNSTGSGGFVTPAATMEGKTPKTRRRRSSIGVPGTVGARTPLLSPALKGRRLSTSSVGVTPSVDPFKPRPVWSVFVGLFQKLATTKGLERASARGPTVDTLVKCVPILPLAERAHFLRYLLKLAKSKVSLHRLMVCELLGLFLAQDWLLTHEADTVATDHLATDIIHTQTPLSQTSTDEETRQMPLPLALWNALRGRLFDKLAAVRARAAAAIESATSVHSNWLDESLLASLRKRALKDETATVRKAAVLALNKACLSKPDLLSEQYIHTFCDLCYDSSLLTRKAAADSITTLLEANLDHPGVGLLLEQSWSACVLPMVLDEDVAPKAIASFDQVVISQILSSSPNNRTSQEQPNPSLDAAWRLLAHVATVSGGQGTSKGSRQALQTALRQLAQEDADRIYNQLWRNILLVAQQCLGDQEASESRVIGVWCLLEALLLSAPSTKHIKGMVQNVKKRPGNLNLETLCDTAWADLQNRFKQTRRTWILWTLKSCLCVVSHIVPAFDEQSLHSIYNNLLENLKLLGFPAEVTGAAIKALTAVTARLDTSNALALCTEWIRSTYKACEAELFDSFQVYDDLSFSQDRQGQVIRALFCAGELALVGFRPDDDDKDIANKSGRIQDTDALRGLHEKPSKRLQELVMTLLAPTLSSSRSAGIIPTNVRAHAFTVLGKLALRDEILAKNSLNILARELHPSASNTCPAVQSNALLVLGDLCVMYTNMADRYLPVMASCLQAGATDPESNMLSSNSTGFATTRKHAILLLSSLLLQDYIKWRGLLFHRFLVACSDENEEVASLAESVLSGPLSTRNPKLFFNHFVEALFVLNKCTAHPIYIAAANQGDGGSGIAVGFDGIYLDGELGRIRRQRMYEFLLNKLSDEEKIGVTARLAKEVLGEAASSEGDLARVCQLSQQEFGPKLQSAWNVLTDALAILTNKAIKVGKNHDDDDAVDDPNVPNPTRQVSIAKNRLLSKISRKHLIEIVLPILCNLKSKLQASCSPLLKDLMAYLVDIFKSYKTEVKEYLANNPTLLQEIEYDARQYASQNGP